jgi:hypothetical protein
MVSSTIERGDVQLAVLFSRESDHLVEQVDRGVARAAHANRPSMRRRSFAERTWEGSDNSITYADYHDELNHRFSAVGPDDHPVRLWGDELI